MRALKSVVEAAELLRISPWTVRSYIKTGKLKPVRLGRRVLLTDGELERLHSTGAVELLAAVERSRVVHPDRVPSFCARHLCSSEGRAAKDGRYVA